MSPDSYYLRPSIAHAIYARETSPPNGGDTTNGFLSSFILEFAKRSYYSVSIRVMAIEETILIYYNSYNNIMMLIKINNLKCRQMSVLVSAGKGLTIKSTNQKKSADSTTVASFKNKRLGNNNMHI